jgi:magnesium chelatase subunit I
MSIANYENLVSSAERRAVVAGEDPAVARCSDLAALVASSRGKMELTMTEEPGQEDKLVGRLIDEAVKTVFDQAANPKQFRNVIEHFEQGKSLELSDRLSAKDVLTRIGEIRGFRAQVDQLAGQLEPSHVRGSAADGVLASVAEFLLHGLHCHNRLNRVAKGTGMVFGQ